MDARELEVRCSGCGAGFAVGTRSCVHCGRALGARSGQELLLPPPGTDTDSGAEQASDENARLNSLLSGGVMLAVVLASALIRACS
jgi:hypothetical protein